MPNDTTIDWTELTRALAEPFDESQIRIPRRRHQQGQDQGPSPRVCRVQERTKIASMLCCQAPGTSTSKHGATTA